jgi:hypothetical protein
MGVSEVIRGQLPTPLSLAGYAIPVSIHLGVRAVTNKVRGFFAGTHMGAVGAAVTFELRAWGGFWASYCGLNRLRFIAGD